MNIPSYISVYPLVIWLFNRLPWKITILIGKSSINGPFSVAMLNNHWVP